MLAPEVIPGVDHSQKEERNIAYKQYKYLVKFHDDIWLQIPRWEEQANLSMDFLTS